MRILNLPLPIFAAALLQIEPPQLSAPAWVNSFLIALFVLGYFLNLAGKFPFTSSERRNGGFGDEDRKQQATQATQAVQVADIHRTVTREDADKPGWPMVWHSSRESREMCAAMTKLAGLADTWVRDREEWKDKQASMERRITELEETIRRQGHVLKYGTGGVQG